MADTSRRSLRQNLLEEVESTISHEDRGGKSSFRLRRNRKSRNEGHRFTRSAHNSLIDEEIFIGRGGRVHASTPHFQRRPTSDGGRRDVYLMNIEGMGRSNGERRPEVCASQLTTEGRKRSSRTSRANTQPLQRGASPVLQPDESCGEEEDQYDGHLLDTSKTRTGTRLSRRSGSGQQYGPLEISYSSNPASPMVHRGYDDIENCGVYSRQVRQENMTAGRSFPRSPVNGFGGASPLNLSALLRKQEEVLSRRRRLNVRDTRRQRRRLRLLESGEDGPTESIPRTIVERWERTLDLLPHDFFISSEARMEEMSRVQKGIPAYQALPIDATNCKDMQHIYMMKYEAKRNMGQSTAAYDQFRTAVGQYLRLCVASNIVDLNLLYEKGHVFLSITHLSTVRAFIMYFQIRGSASTVAGKSLHLKVLAHQAQIFYNGKDKELVGKAMAVEEYLLGQASAQKNEARRCARVRKSTEERLSRGVMFFPEDFSRCVKVARRHLDGIISSFRYAVQEAGGDRAIRELSRNRRLIEKWSINFLAALLLCGGGQRPQVYCQVQVPLEDELEMIQRRVDQDGFIELKTVVEKTARGLDMPNVIFPTYMLDYIKFQAKYVRPIIVEGTNLDEQDFQEKPLLLNTRNGDPISSSQVCSTLRRFLCKIDPELSKVTPMALRGSYATMMLQSYKQGKLFQNKTEQEFLEFLGKAMNTSVEQLANTYAGFAHGDFRHCAREMTSVLAELGEQDAAGSNGEGEERDQAAEYLWS